MPVPLPSHAKQMYTGPLLQAYQYEQELYDGTIATFESIVRPDVASTLAFLDRETILITRQEQPNKLLVFWALPGGRLDTGEHPDTAALRELEEETGYTSERMTHIASFNPNPALFSNKIHFFLAEGCFINPDREHFPDSSEDIEIVLVPLDELEERVARGEINHALAALGIMLSLRRLKSGN
jgi:ADP-ribose pyrophosphatase